MPPILINETLCQNLSLLEMIRDIARTLPWQEFDLFRQHLLLTIYASRFQHNDPKEDISRVQAAASAISILTVMRIPFSGYIYMALGFVGHICVMPYSIKRIYRMLIFQKHKLGVPFSNLRT